MRIKTIGIIRTKFWFLVTLILLSGCKTTNQTEFINATNFDDFIENASKSGATYFAKARTNSGSEYYGSSSRGEESAREIVREECQSYFNEICIVVESTTLALHRAQKNSEQKTLQLQKQRQEIEYLTIDLDSAKTECEDLGFKKGTEKFGECVLKLSE